MTDRSLVDFLKASRPLWKQPQLEAVEKKLQKVGVRSLLELVIALRGAADQSLNNRLLAVGERCFTSETLTAFGAFLGEDEASDAQFHRKVSGEGTLNEEVAMHTLSVLAPNPSPSKGSLHPPPQPSSKDAMRAALAGLGLHLHVQRTCPARELRALLLEAHRCRGLSRADLLAECRGRLGLPAAARQLPRPRSWSDLSWELLSPQPWRPAASFQGEKVGKKETLPPQPFPFPRLVTRTLRTLSASRF
ncbi:unnamed protein product [Polarella glacialis]|uniref:Uncharacterized protein n=1 Tax=Polarella glacialis TaxID=89957 RepID=A0A813IEH3_POLGL|nr:unnamed protein product [Polarella glacialis]